MLLDLGRNDVGRVAAKGSVTVTDSFTVTADDEAGHAARLMAEHEVNHLIVVHPESGRPVGVISALDLAGSLGFDARP